MSRPELGVLQRQAAATTLNGDIYLFGGLAETVMNSDLHCLPVSRHPTPPFPYREVPSDASREALRWTIIRCG
jgi:hypothetical protein